jgi:hypothetical protein
MEMQIMKGVQAMTMGLRQYQHPILLEYNMFDGKRGPVFYCFVDRKTGEQIYGAREDIEMLIQLLQLQLKWLKDDEEPNADLGVATSSADSQGGTPPVGQEASPSPSSSPTTEAK